jgi:hypothetical protein
MMGQQRKRSKALSRMRLTIKATNPREELTGNAKGQII